MGLILVRISLFHNVLFCRFNIRKLAIYIEMQNSESNELRAAEKVFSWRNLETTVYTTREKTNCSAGVAVSYVKIINDINSCNCIDIMY